MKILTKKCTVVIVLPFQFELKFHYTASDYQSAATIVLLLVIYDSDLLDYLAGGKVRPHGEENPICEQRASIIDIILVQNEEDIALGSTYIAMMTLIATNIQHVRNKPLQICVTTSNTSTTVQILISSIAIATNNKSPTAVITFLLHQLIEDENLKSYIRTQSEKKYSWWRRISLGNGRSYPTQINNAHHENSGS